MSFLSTALFALCLVGCASSPRPAAEPPQPPVTAASPAPRPPDSQPTSAIIRQPIAPAELLEPCGVVLVHTSFDEETKAPTVTRHPVRRLVREWSDELRETEWRDVAPIPLSSSQAQLLLPSPEELGPEAGGGLFATVGDGVLSYQFDQAGRTIRVGWDPTADSSDYVYEYSYTCASTAERPHHDPATP